MSKSRELRPVALHSDGTLQYAFCPTGEGGGKDPTCSAHSATQDAVAATNAIAKKDLPYDSADRAKSALKYSSNEQHYGAAKMHGILSSGHAKEAARLDKMKGREKDAELSRRAAALHDKAAKMHRLLDRPA